MLFYHQASPVNLPGCGELCDNWELISNVTVDGSMHVSKYQSKRTGLKIVLGDAESPVGELRLKHITL